MNASREPSPSTGGVALTEAVDVIRALLPSEVLAKAADLIEPEGAWTRGGFARDSGGGRRTSGSEEAVCWCAAGAVLRVGRHPDAAHDALNKLRSVVGYDIVHFNDAPGRTQAEVVAALRQASDLARSEGQ